MYEVLQSGSGLLRLALVTQIPSDHGGHNDGGLVRLTPKGLDPERSCIRARLSKSCRLSGFFVEHEHPFVFTSAGSRSHPLARWGPDSASPARVGFSPGLRPRPRSGSPDARGPVPPSPPPPRSPPHTAPAASGSSPKLAR